jgi:Beta-glucanase/Beta-glucan synthetase
MKYTMPCVGVLMGLSMFANSKPYKSAEIFTLDSELYGKYVIRMQAAKGSGVISNFFLWKEGSELTDVFWEEVDIEIFGKDDGYAWQSNIITGLGNRITTEQEHTSDYSFGEGYHTFTLEWIPGQVRWLVDGQLVREVNGGQANDLTSLAQARFNFWPPNIEGWVGPFNDTMLPLSMYVNWMEYHQWNGQNFELSWRDDFDTLNASRWGKADWTFDENRADFSPENALTRNGYLILTMTHEGQEGYSGTPPEDTGDGPTPTPTPTPTATPTSIPTQAPGGEDCNWYGTVYPLCINTTSGWGWENSQSCIGYGTCSAQPAPLA